MGLPDPGRPRGSGSGVGGPDTPAMTSSPVSRVVYNGKRNSSPRSPPNSSEIFTPAHEENVRFIYEAWQGVERDLRSQMSGSERGLVEEYVEKVPNPSLKTFKPIDLSDLKRRNTQDAKKS
ncbi:mapk-regulated corepressor-interacting protein 1 isoform X1 [Cervus elaphus]|uniref:mapk-regulated corepressor-interacting protein 1 isoform X1 n=1 Tax=Cervus canadensis TaxID=1574408 RepID=UPI001C9E3E15|nr:mapk-regulated corepressor-interacting protein 1 isoform X1 [Cervus canadensis]XP_043761132.1 mapk-regulated corepressor-interacting protein 1 isoform X1 [Cervus elaphus]